MKVVVFGASGMVGQGVLRECLLDPEIESVLAIGRSATGRQDAKLREILHEDLFDLSSIEADLAGLDACFFCLGSSAAGMSEPDYRRVNYEMPLAVARTLARLDPGMTFIYISGAGTDSGERGRSMWARVKGQTENALLALPFKAAYMFRPGYIQPKHGIRSKTGWYRILYASLGWLYPVIKALAPTMATTTEQLGRAMIVAAKHGAPKRVLEGRDINTLS
jgi:uncharacterized protein YbjT (DUF2867 family)